jgi:hypothetical protein
LARCAGKTLASAKAGSVTDSPDSAFWKDRLFGEDERNMVRFRIGDVVSFDLLIFFPSAEFYGFHPILLHLASLNIRVVLRAR